MLLDISGWLKTLERKDSKGRSAEPHAKLKARQLRAVTLAEAGFDAFNPF